MSENAKLLPQHYLVITFISVNILLISFLPTLSNKQKRLKTIAKSLGLIFLAFNLFCSLKFLFEIIFHGMDGGFLAISFLILFSIADIYLAKRIIKL